MNRTEAVVELRKALPSCSTFLGLTEDDSEPVGWDFYGNVTAIECRSTPREKPAIIVYWKNKSGGFMGLEIEEENISAECISAVVRLATEEMK